MPSAPKTPIIPIQDFNMGGLADSLWAGVKNSLFKLTGWDIHSKPGILVPAQKLSLYSPPDIVNEYCEARVVSTNGRVYWFSAESGNIWEDNNGVFTLVYTIIPSAGEAKILDAYEYQQTIYIATERYLHKITTSLAIAATPALTQAAWLANMSLNWANFTNGDLNFHPMMEQNLVLFIGDGNLLAQVDDGVFSPDALDIKPPLRIKSLGKVATDVLVGTFVSDNVTKTELLRWNTWSDSFQASNQVNEVGINAFLPGDNILFVQAGLFGRIYYYDSNLNRLESFKNIPGDYSPTAYGTVNPNAVANLNNIVLLGFSNLLGNPADQGIYQIGRHSRSYPYVLDMPYPISKRVIEVQGDEEVEVFALEDIEIGAIAVRGFDVYFSWRHTEGDVVTVGIDKIDYSEKLDGAYLETRVMLSPNRFVLANYSAMIIAYASMPEGCGVLMSVAKNYGEFEPVPDPRPDIMRNILFSDNLSIEATSLRAKIVAVTNGNDAPEIESAALLLR